MPQLMTETIDLMAFFNLTYLALQHDTRLHLLAGKWYHLLYKNSFKRLHKTLFELQF